MIAFVEARKQLKIFVSPDAKKIVEDFADRFDMKEHGVASRIYRWFASLPEPVQKWVVGLSDGKEGDAIGLFIKALKGERIRPLPSDIRDAVSSTHPSPDPKRSEPAKENARNSRADRSK